MTYPTAPSPEAEAMREAAIWAVQGFLVEAPTGRENRLVEAAVKAIRAIRTTDPASLRSQQVELLARVETTDPDAFTDRDWSIMLGLRDLGLTTMVPHPVWRFVPYFGAFKKLARLTPAGNAALAFNQRR